MQGFEKNPIGPFLYALEFTVTEFGSSQENELLFVQAFDYFCKNIIEVLATPENCMRNSYLTNDYFGLCKRILRYNEFIFYRNSHLMNFAQVLINSCGIDHYQSTMEIKGCFKEILKGLEQDVAQGVLDGTTQQDTTVVANKRQMWSFMK